MPYFVDGPNGKEEGYLQWNNMINGMPPAGHAFSANLHTHLRDFGMMTTMQDANVFVSLGPDGSYLRVGVNVDDMLVIAKPKELVAPFDAHIRKRWTMTEAPLAGWLNIQFYARGDARTVTMVMDARLTEIMHEHLLREMELTKASYLKRLATLGLGERARPGRRLVLGEARAAGGGRLRVGCRRS